jgi:hypothetical protein
MKVKICDHRFSFCPLQIEWRGKMFCNPLYTGKCKKEVIKWMNGKSANCVKTERTKDVR